VGKESKTRVRKTESGLGRTVQEGRKVCKKGREKREKNIIIRRREEWENGELARTNLKTHPQKGVGGRSKQNATDERGTRREVRADRKTLPPRTLGNKGPLE